MLCWEGGHWTTPGQPLQHRAGRGVGEGGTQVRGVGLKERRKGEKERHRLEVNETDED